LGKRSLTICGRLAGYSGVGLLTKIEPIEVKFGIGIPEHDTEGRVITAEYEKFYLVASYIPNSGRKLVRLSYRQQFNRVLRTYLQELNKKKPVIW
jgi:exonuclease III